MRIIQLKDEILNDIVGGDSPVDVFILRDPLSQGRQPAFISVTEPGRIDGHGPDVRMTIPPYITR